MTTFREEFPNFPPEDMPPIPAGWLDTSWHNDACPSFAVDDSDTGLSVYIDYADPKMREATDADGRFIVIAEGRQDAFFISDDWDTVLAFIQQQVTANQGSK